MLKFSKYFFLMFFAVTIIPLTFMFLWNHYEMNEFSQKKEAVFFDNATKQADTFIKEYLSTRENFIERTVNNLIANNITINQYKNIFDTDDIYLVTKDFKFKGDLAVPGIIKNLKKSDFEKKLAYYEIIQKKNQKPELISIVIIPLKNAKYKALIVTDNVSVNELYQSGPFNLELYSGNKIQRSNLLAVKEDPLLNHNKGMLEPPPNMAANNGKNEPNIPPPPHEGFMPPPPMDGPNGMHGPMDGPNGMHDGLEPKPSQLLIFETKLINHFQKAPTNRCIFKTIALKNNNNKPVATILLRSKMHPGLHLINIEEQKLGFVILLTGAISSLIIGFNIKQNFVNPMILLTSAAKRIKNGDLSFKIKSKVNHSETKETIKVFNDMIDGLIEKNELRNNFITNLTHDLRTPLLAQERAIELIISEFEALNLEDQANLAKGIDKNNKHLLRMVNFILEAYRFDSGNVKVASSDFDLFNLVELCCSQIDALARNKQIKLTNNIPQDFGTIHTDKDSLKRIFLNLMANAIDNIPVQSEVKVEVQKTEHSVKLFVTDNGTGISAKDIDYIFDRFYTGKSDERKIGSGLGLFVCKKLTELNGGKISVESEVNKFTKFTIELPL